MRVPNLRNRLKRVPKACWPAVIAAVLAIIKAVQACVNSDQGDGEELDDIDDPMELDFDDDGDDDDEEE